MNYRVPEFEMEGDYYSLPASSPRSRKSTMPEDEVMELLWQNGQVVMQSQTQRSGHKKSKYDAVIPEPTRPPAAQPPPVNQPQNPQLFMQEDEMATWLQCPLGYDDPFCAELLYTDSRNAQSNNTAANLPPISPPPPPRPPIHPPPPAPRRTELPNFLHFSRITNNNNNKSRYESAAVGPSGSKSVDSRLDASSNNASGGGRGLAATATMSFGAAASAGKDAVTCETSLTSSTGDSSASGSLSAEQMSIQKQPPPPPPPPVEDRKRKGRVADDAECQSEDVEFESGSGKKQTRGSSSTKRSRAAEVHNLSERRRRDRINEKMRSLQELIPRCNKSDKASMLDEAIEYLKSLQLQVQMMSMGCGMVPMMFPGVQQYMPMGMGMGMGMGMEMGMSRPVMPFPNVLAGSTMPTAPATAHMGPRFPLPPFRMQTMLPNDPSRVQATNQSEHMLNSLGTQNQNQSRVTNFADPYQQYFTPQQMRMQLQQNQAMPQPSSSKPSSSMGPENQESHQ